MLKLVPVLLTMLPSYTAQHQVVVTGQTTDHVDSRMHINWVDAIQENNKIVFHTEYYINTGEETNVRFRVGNSSKTESYKADDAKKLSDSIEVDYTQTNSLSVDFEMIISTAQDSTSIVGTFNFDDGAIDKQELNQNGKYTYKFEHGVKFDNDLQDFEYTYNEVDFEIIPEKFSDPLKTDQLFKVEDGVEYEYALSNINGLVETDDYLPKGYYLLELLIIDKGPVSSKKLGVSYEFEITKDLFGDCGIALNCIEEASPDGEIFETEEIVFEV